MTTIVLREKNDGPGYGTNLREYLVDPGEILVIDHGSLTFRAEFEHGLIDPKWFQIGTDTTSFKIDANAKKGCGYDFEFFDISPKLTDDVLPRVKVKVKP